MIKNLIVYLDGEYVSSHDAKVSVFDHGLLYGDGIFEGIRVYDGVVFQLKAHLDRLYDCAKVIWLKIPLSKTALEDAILETLHRNRLRDAYIRLVVTRGKGDLGLDPRKCPKASIIIIAKPVNPLHGAATQEQGISTIVASIRRQPTDSTSHEIKSLNYLNSIQAKLEANAHGVDDAIMLDHRGFVAEASVTALFAVKNNELLTPPLNASILNSITRQFIINIAQELGINVREADLTVFQLRTAVEVFLCGTFGEIVPVVKINHQSVGNQCPGPITSQIITEFRKRRKDPKYGTPVKPMEE